MKVAAYQVPLHAIYSFQVVSLIRQQISWCEQNGVEILCCPEAVLGGLADYVDDPSNVALEVGNGQLARLLEPLSSQTVTTIVGFTETCGARFYNSAAVFQQGSVVGVYRKMHPAINRSVYTAGDEMPVFTTGKLRFGIIICYDSNFAEPARTMIAKGAVTLFIPTNNGMPIHRATANLVEEARRVDIQRAQENRIYVVRADVAGQDKNLLSYGSSGVIDPHGRVLVTASKLAAQVVVANIETMSE
jgi:predicted amidohydrolase